MMIRTFDHKYMMICWSQLIIIRIYGHKYMGITFLLKLSRKYKARMKTWVDFCEPWEWRKTFFGYKNIRQPWEDLWIHGNELLLAQLSAWTILQETLVPFLGKQRWPTKEKSMKTFATRAFIRILVHSLKCESFHPSIHSGQVNFGVKESPRSIVKLHFNDRFKFHTVSQPLISSLALIVSLVSL